ncbi:helix-turn-helix domain-containing protein [Streptomyces sp. NPDC057555]|uniref:helix-turn-helix domain-containing protein n=1 Tax=Streptomyces sp. NPDC057555 TaxID=3346166 RepID=UPI00369AA53B
MNRNELNPDASPEAAYGARLRSVREARGWTQEELGSHAEYSSVHISFVENGRKPPTLRFSRSLDRAFGLDGTADSFEHAFREMTHGSLLEGFPEYKKFEGRASEIRLYEVGVVPGLLQTPEYAAALVESEVRRGAITRDQADERLALVAERQAALNRPRPPLVFVVLDESCVVRPMGEHGVMDRQLMRLIEFAELPDAVVQVAPFAMGDRRPFNLPITVLTLPDRSLMSYAESAQRGHLERDSTCVVPILRAYHQLQAESLSQADSVAMLNQLRKGTP